jgi:hypothetical protein
MHCTNINRDGRFSVGYGKTDVTPCGLLQNQFQHYLSLLDVETNTMVCRMTEDIAENSQ